MTELVVTAAAPLLATLDQLKTHLVITRPVHDIQLTIYLEAASDKVRGMVRNPPAAGGTLATLLYAQYLWELTQRRSARAADDDGASMLVNPEPEMRRLLGLPPSNQPPAFAGSI